MSAIRHKRTFFSATRFGPNRAHLQWRWITWGSSIATILWLIGTQSFARYAQHFASCEQV